MTPALQERIHQIWDEVAAFEAAESDAALQHLLKEVADLVDAQNAYWVGAVRISDDERDPLLGWRPRLIRYLHALPNDDKFSQQRIKELGKGKVD